MRFMRSFHRYRPIAVGRPTPWHGRRRNNALPTRPLSSTALALFLIFGTVVYLASGRGLELDVEHAPCVRLFHSGGNVGCRSVGRKGAVGTLLAVENEDQLRGIERMDHDLGEDIRVGGDGLVIVMPTGMFNATTLGRLAATGVLAGVLVMGNEGHDCEHGTGRMSAPDGYSPAVSTPQGNSTPTANFDVDASHPWNPRGDGLLMQSLNFPVALVTGASREEVWGRASSNGRLGESSWRFPLHKARMTFYFGGSEENLNSQACLAWETIDGERSPQCLPLGGQSSWASVGPPGDGGKEVVFAVAGMDATSSFHDLAPGANAAASGLVALLAAAEAVGAVGRSGAVDLKALARQIVFAAFQSEAYGFTGSRRFVKDYLEGVSCQKAVDPAASPTGREACLDPLYPSLEFQKLGKPAYVVAVDQVGYLPESTLWLHPSPKASANDVEMLSRVSPQEGTGFVEGLTVANASSTELPPTPLTPFVKADPTQSGFVLSGYDEAFSGPNYHGIGDTRETVTVSSVASAASLLARSALRLAGADEASVQALEVNATLVETLLDCVTENWMCDIFLEYVLGEVADIEATLGFRVKVDAPFPPTLYRGPLEFRTGGGLPTVRHTSEDGSWRLYPKWTEEFDPAMDKIQLVPNILEIFCRAFLSEQAGSGYAGRYGHDECRSSGDCSAATCDAAHASDEGGAAGKAECVRGRCACPVGFHHIALDVGLEREENLNNYKVLGQGGWKEGVALWTEVNWQSIGVQVFLDPGEAVGKVALALGTAVTAAAGAGSWAMFRSLSKHKLF